LEKYGLKVFNLHISQVKRKCGIEVGQLCEYVDTNPKEIISKGEPAIKSMVGSSVLHRKKLFYGE